MMYDYNMFEQPSVSSGMGLGGIIWIVVAFLAAIVGCFVVYFTFVQKDKKLNNKFLTWLRDYLRFDKMLIETILKIAYIFAAICITLVPLAFINSFGAFICVLLVIIFGNLITRIVYELSLIRVMIWKNTTEIKNKVK